MFQRIDLLHFKCFELLRLPLRPLTLLSGLNASGKSSVMQAFALFHQTVREHEWSSGVMLNGSAVRLGTPGDVIDHVSGGRGCGIGLRDGDTEYQWDFLAERSDMAMTVTKIAIDEQQFVAPDGEIMMLHHLLPAESDGRPGFDNGVDLVMRLEELSYLTAERTGPRDIYPLEGREHFGVVGARGEHAVSLMYSRGDDPVVDALALAGAAKTGLRQVEARMATFFPGCELEVSRIPRANSLTLGVRTSHQTDFHRPGHTGFGITQVLPIVVASLLARPGGLLLIENPEVHLHPAGQAKMGEFLAEVAAAGVQVVLETHSDHVLNGARRAVRSGVLKGDETAVHFFRSREDAERDGGTVVQSPELADDGRIDHWPDGFFDQFDKDMNYFAGWG